MPDKPLLPLLTGEDSHLGKPSLRESEPATEIAVTTQPEMPTPAHFDDTHLVPPSSSNERCAIPGKHSPTLSTLRLPSCCKITSVKNDNVVIC